MAKDEVVSEIIGDLLEGIAGRMEDVAQEAGVSYSALYSWATGRRRPGRRNLQKLAKLARERANRLEELAEQLQGQVDSARGASGDSGRADSGRAGSGRAGSGRGDAGTG